MAHSPRKAGSGRQPAESTPSGDLFTGPAAPESDSEPPEEWTLEDGPSPKGKAGTLPSINSLPNSEPSPPTSAPSPATGSIKITPLAGHDDARFESNPRPPAGSTHAPALPALPALPATPRPAPVQQPLEIEDPFEIGEELPAVESKPVAMPGANRAADLTTEDEGISQDGSGLDTESAAAPIRLPASKAGLLAAAGLLLALLGLFFGVLYTNRPVAAGADSRSDPSLPLKGQVAILSGIESGWRTRQPGDQVSTVDVTLPLPSRKQPALMPMVRITTEPAATSGFLRFIFIDPEGKISGDVRVVKINAGTIEPLSSGAKVSGPGTAIIFGSLGFMDRPGFVAYATGASPRWSVEVSESTSYNSKEEGWKKLDTFDLRNASDP